MLGLRSAAGTQAAVLVAAATAGALIAVTGSSSAGTGALRYTTTSAALSTVTDRISATGTVAADATLDLTFGATSQTVTAVNVHAGQHVHKGDLLATVDASSATAAVTAAQAAVTAAAESTATTSASSTASSTSAPTSSNQPAAGTTVCRTTTVTTRPLPPPGGSSPSHSATPAPAPSGSASASPSPSASAHASPSQSASPSTSSSPTWSSQPRPAARNAAPTPTSSRSGTGQARSTGGSATVRTTRTCTTTHTSRASATSHAGGTSSTNTGGAGGGSVGSLTAAEQQLASAQAALAATKLVAPQDGVVSAVNLTVGTLPSTPAIELRTATLSVQVPVAEQDAPYVQAGQQVELTFTALDVTGTGNVTAAPLEPSTATSGSTSTGTGRGAAGGAEVVTYPVNVAIADPPPGVLVGMSVQAAWTAATQTNVLAVPTAAIQGGDVGYVVRVLTGGSPHARAVTLGLSTTSLSEITSGLRPGDRVVTGVR